MSTRPTSELGSIQDQGIFPLGWSTLVDKETTPELRWPNSVRAYDKMRTDQQLASLLFGMLGPLRRYRWRLDPNGARPDVVNRIAEDMGVPVAGLDPVSKPRSKRRFNHGRHLYHALLALTYGHMYMEQVGEIVDGWWRLRKLSPRMPQTIKEIQVAKDGGLVGIKQSTGWNAPVIPVDRLVAYVWEQEGGNWVGRSILRECYGSWLIKDRLVRVDAMKHQRNGLGVPITEAPPGATPQQVQSLDQLAQRFKAGEASGGVIPSGSKLRLVGTEGSVPDTVASMRYHDEGMARRFWSMVAQLGQTHTGSRALGGTFADLLSIVQQIIADWYVEVTNEHVIEDWVDWNYGPDEPAPLLMYETDESLSVQDMIALVDKGLITIDDELEAWIRGRHRLPDRLEEDAPSGRSYEYDLNWGILTVNERRAQIGLDPLPDGDRVPEPPEARREEPAQAQQPRRRDRRGELEEMAREASRRQRRSRAPRKPQEPTSPPAHAGSQESRFTGTRPVLAAARDIDYAMLPDESKRRRLPYAHEVRAQVDFNELEATISSHTDRMLEKWAEVREAQIAELSGAIDEAGDDLGKLAQIRATPQGAEILRAEMEDAMREGAELARAEALRQGRTVPAPNLDDAAKSVAQRAEAVDELLARSLSEAAGRNAVARAGGSLSSAQVAEEVGEHLRGLSDSYLRDQFNGSINQAIGTGRREAMIAGGASKYYASEMLDVNACDTCIFIDGQEYSNVLAAEQDYPTGGYKDCLAGIRCRGSLIAVYEEAEPTQEEPT